MPISGNLDWSTSFPYEMISDLDSLTVKFAGEPSTGNLYTRFDEGRGGLAEWAGPLVYSIGPFQIPNIYPTLSTNTGKRMTGRVSNVLQMHEILHRN